MANEQARDLRQRGITAAKAGQKDEARRLLQQAIRLEPDSEAAWLWLASVARDAQERLFCLQKILEINPFNDTAQKAIDSLNAPPTPSAPLVKRLPNAPVTASAASSPPKMTTHEIAQQPGVPLPAPERIADAQKVADSVVRAYLAPPPAALKWVRKTRGRAGERDALVYRMYVAGGVLGVIVVLLVASLIVVNTNDDLRGVVYGPSATPTLVPTATYTPTPGITPTPSATPRLTLTPSPTVPAMIQTSDPYIPPRATSVYPALFDRPLIEAVALIDQGDISRALPTLEAERQLTFDTRFDPNPYYYEALARMEQGRFNDALEVLDEAESRLEERADEPGFRGLVDLGYARVNWALAQQAAEAGDTERAQEYAAETMARAQSAVEVDSRLAQGYLLQAQVHSTYREFPEALRVLDQGLGIEALTSNVDLIMAKGYIYYAQRNYDQALYQAFLARYIDPTTESAYQLQIRASLDRDRPGQAVLYAEDYLFYYPGSTTAFRLLGDARAAEGNIRQAIDAYTRGLAGDTTDRDSLAMLEARAALYQERRQHDRAADDYARLVELTDDSRYQLLHMQAVYDEGDYTAALNDAETLIEAGNGNGIANAILGCALVQTADDTNSAWQRAAVMLVEAAALDALPPDARARTQECLAQAQLALGNEGEALQAIDAALALGETGSRRYLRGQVLQASGEADAAIAEYEWVLAWSQLYPFPFRVDVEDRLDALRG